ncbi:hypothetical protein B7P43_G00917 [Cryptotermes secundus]|uniref:Envelope fusion protein n=1 Tax=Cryptotermes secundus TaxID=105785 RepID=A0A2J7RT21_9NEOP|nr:uncharacterized protein LOC111866466 [Cryptotermes secundus]PNF43974.1 hypothetical protein B7P43_G00917 [Cryptotermes secundus]
MRLETLLILSATCVAVVAVDFTVKNYEDTPGLYYDHIGQVQLYTSEWKLVTYVNISKLETTYNTLVDFVAQTGAMCKELPPEAISTCQSDLSLMNQSVLKIHRTRRIISEITKNKEEEVFHSDNTHTHAKRIKRGVFNFIGTVSKILFGTLSSEDADYYQNKISELESEQLSMLKVAKEQMTVVRSTLQTVNYTLVDIAANELQINENSRTMQKQVNENVEKTNQAFSQTTLLIATNQHMIIIEHLIGQLKEGYDTLLFAIIFAQKGILSPQIITPGDIIRAFQDSHSILPRDLSLPNTARVAYEHVLMNIIDIDVFLNNNLLGYVLKIPLVNSAVFHLYKLIPFPTKVNNSENIFVFIESEKDFLMIDTLKQVYVKLNELELDECKVISPDWRVCKQTFPVKSTHVHQECEVRLLEPTTRIPLDCKRKIISLDDVTWLPLTHNKWIFATSHKERVTILCNDLEPSDIILQGTGVLSMFGRCDALGLNTKLQTQMSFTSNRTDKDFIPSVTLHYDCCEHLGSRVKLDTMKFIPDVPLKNILGHSNAFKYASHSVDQVEQLIIQNEAELNRDHKIDHLKFLSYLGITIMVVMMLLICCCFCKRCNFLKRFLDDDCCGRICIRQTVINQRELKSSDENITDRFLDQETRSQSLRSLPAATSLEMTELDPVPTVSTHSGVRKTCKRRW